MTYVKSKKLTCLTSMPPPSLNATKYTKKDKYETSHFLARETIILKHFQYNDCNNYYIATNPQWKNVKFTKSAIVFRSPSREPV